MCYQDNFNGKEIGGKMCDFSKCKIGIHPFIVIAKSGVPDFSEKVVRWCPECGAVVVDADFDNRTNAGYYRKLQYPNITKKYGFN